MIGPFGCRSERSAVLRGAVDGQNTLFWLDVPHVFDTLTVMVDGIAPEHRGGRGWHEVGRGAVRLVQAPRTGALVEAFYRPAYALLPWVGPRG